MESALTDEPITGLRKKQQNELEDFNMSDFDQYTNGGMNLENTSEEDSMVLNLEGVSEEMPEFEALPPGVYDCIVENAEFKVSQSGNPMIAWQFRCIDPEYENRLLFYHTVLNKEAGQGRLKRILVRVCPDVPLGNFSPKNFCEQGLALGLPCRVKVRVRPYEGKRRNDVTDVLPPLAAGDGFMNEIV